ncbi:hypothetical protein [Phenylobacterium sp.]|jgi:hypothetical protein|uniref:hypothetical protein n=1 Tax=Phenylobacterium sp. TaxID=1871053 RepID=UPI0037833D95
MPELGLPAGASVRLTITGRADRDLHRWNVSVLPAAGGPARLTFGSWIGGRDLHQRIDIPAQDVDCRLEIQSRHHNAQGWADDRASPEEDTPDRLLIGFCNPSTRGARPDDVLLSFAFDTRDRQLAKEDADGQGEEENEPEVRKPKQPKARPPAASRSYLEPALRVAAKPSARPKA